MLESSATSLFSHQNLNAYQRGKFPAQAATGSVLRSAANASLKICGAESNRTAPAGPPDHKYLAQVKNAWLDLHVIILLGLGNSVLPLYASIYCQFMGKVTISGEIGVSLVYQDDCCSAFLDHQLAIEITPYDLQYHLLADQDSGAEKEAEEIKNRLAKLP